MGLVFFFFFSDLFFFSDWFCHACHPYIATVLVCSSLAQQLCGDHGMPWLDVELRISGQHPSCENCCRTLRELSAEGSGRPMYSYFLFFSTWYTHQRPLKKELDRKFKSLQASP